ncbi:MAG: Transcriptional regulator [Bacteroidetes bacterium]|nr:Transcriptional regulator [Bacteroidota bacterium]
MLNYYGVLQKKWEYYDVSEQTKIRKAFATHIDQLRKDRNLSFQEMADACEMDKAQVYKLCTEGTDVRLSTMLKIAIGFNVPLAEILNFRY